MWNYSGEGNDSEDSSLWGEDNGTLAANCTADLYHVSPGLVTLLSILYGSISFLTIVGNALIIVVILKNRSMNTVTNFFIANLSVADVIVGFFSIPFQFQAALLQRWDLPAVLCPVAPFVKELSVNVSVTALVVISVDRYFAVLHPLRPRFTRRSAKAVMAVVWAMSVTSAIPTLVVFRVIDVTDDDVTDDDDVIGGGGRRDRKPFCFPQFPVFGGKDLGYVYRLYLVFVQYFVPLVIITWAYVLIIHRMWLSKAPGSAVDSRDQVMNRNKKKVIKMLIIVVGLFSFCWLPIQVYNLLSEVHPQINLYKYINIIWFCSNWLAMSNSCYNPFIYGLLNEKFKQGFRRLFRRCLAPLGIGHSGSNAGHFSDPSTAAAAVTAASAAGAAEGPRPSSNSAFQRRHLTPTARANAVYFASDEEDSIHPKDLRAINRASNDPSSSSDRKGRRVDHLRSNQRRC